VQFWMPVVCLENRTPKAGLSTGLLCSPYLIKCGSNQKSFGALRQFRGDYWRVVAIGAIFTLARFSEAFLVLRAQQAGFAINWVPLVMIVMSLTYSFSAYPAGILSDRVSRRYLLAAGIVLLILADLVLALAGSPSIVLVGVALWGMHMGCTQAILAAMIAEATPVELKGTTAFGLFNLASGHHPYATTLSL
jgi:MFS family permease